MIFTIVLIACALLCLLAGLVVSVMAEERRRGRMSEAERLAEDEQARIESRIW